MCGFSYPSLYFKEHRQYYYDLLNSVQTTGDWEAWLIFFVEAIAATATQGMESINKLAKNGGTGQSDDCRAWPGRAFRRASSRRLAGVAHCHGGLAFRKKRPHNSNSEQHPGELGKKINVVRQLNDSRRNRLFAYGQYMNILNAEIK
jgi:hypothetical protein